MVISYTGDGESKELHLSPIISLEASEFEGRDSIEAAVVVITDAAGRTSRFWVSVGLTKQGQPVVTTATEMKDKTLRKAVIGRWIKKGMLENFKE